MRAALAAEVQQSSSKPFDIDPERAKAVLAGRITVGQLLGLDQRSLYAIARIGHQMLRSGNHEAALDVFRGLCAASPYDSVFHAHLGATLANLEKYDEALSAYSRALACNQGNLDALAGRGELLLRANRVPEALADFQRVLALDPSHRHLSSHRAAKLVELLTRKK